MNLTLLMPLGAAALVPACVRARKVLRESEGSELMQKIAASIRQGANAYLKRQYSGVAKFFAVVFVLMLALSFMGQMEIFVPFAFVTGGFFSAPLRLCRHENRHLLQCQDRLRSKPQPQQRPQGGFLRRVGHGLHRRGTGAA